MDSTTILVMIAVGFVGLGWFVTWAIKQAHDAIPKEVLDKYDNVIGRYSEQNDKLHKTIDTLMPTLYQFADMAVKFTPDKRDDELLNQVKELIKEIKDKENVEVTIKTEGN